jgi:hypothetical protein
MLLCAKTPHTHIVVNAGVEEIEGILRKIEETS